jgi:hypothetical protein
MFIESFEKVAVSGFKWGQAMQNFAAKSGVAAASARGAESGAGMAAKGYSKSIAKVTGADAKRGLTTPIKSPAPSGGTLDYSGFKSQMKSKDLASAKPVQINPQPAQKTPYGMQNVQKRLGPYINYGTPPAR